MHGRWHDVEFQLAFERSSRDSALYVNGSAVPGWLPLGAALDVRKERLSAEAWSESGFWVIAGPAEVASEVMARRGAIAALVGLPLRTVLGMNIEVIGAKRRDCSITCEGWLTDAEKLDRLLYSLAGLCGHRPA